MKHLKLLKIIKTQLKSERKNKQLSPRIANVTRATHHIQCKHCIIQYSRRIAVIEYTDAAD